MKKKMLLSGAFLLIGLFVLAGCAAKKAPDCNDNKTKELVIAKTLEKLTGFPAATFKDTSGEFVPPTAEKGETLRYKYSDGVLEWFDPKDDSNKVQFLLNDTRTSSVNEDTGKYVCEANYYQVMDENGKKERQGPIPVKYTSELTDSKEHYVTVAVKVNPFGGLFGPQPSW